MPTPVTDTATGKKVDLPPEEAQKAIRDGRARATGRVPVQLADGRVGTVDAADLESVLGQGGRLASEEELRVSRIKKEEEGLRGTLQTFAENAASGATFGATDLAARELRSSEDIERARLREEASPIASTLGQLTGAAAGLVSGSAEAGLVARGVGLLGRPGRLLTKGATATGNVVSKGVSKVPGIAKVAPVAGTLTRGGIEGAAGALQTHIHESVLGEKEIVSEHLLPSLIAGAILGGTVDTGLAGVGRIASGLGRVSKSSAAEVTEKFAGGEVPGEVASKIAKWRPSDETADRFARGWAKVNASTTSANEQDLSALMADAIKRGSDSDLVRYLGKEKEISAEAGGYVAQAMRKLVDADAVVDQIATGAMKEKRISKLLEGVDPLKAEAELGTKSYGILEQLDALKRENAERMAGRKYHDPWMLDFEDTVVRGIGNMDEASSVAAKYRAADTLKRDLGKYLEEIRPSRASPSQERVTYDALKKMHGDLRSTLESTDVFGGAGTLQRETNQAWSAAIRAKQDMRGAMKNLVATDGTVDTAKALSYARRFTHDGSGTMVSQLDTMVTAKLKHYDTVLKHYALEPAQREALLEARKAANDMAAGLGERAKAAAMADVLGKVRAAEGNDSPTLSWITRGTGLGGAALGAMLGGAPGALIGGALGRVASSPYTTLRTFAGILQASKAMRSKMAGGVDAISRAVRGASRIADAANRGIQGVRRIAPRIAGTKAESTEERARRAMKALDRVDHEMTAALDANLWALRETAPQLAEQVGTSSMAAARFLISKMPPVYRPPMGGESLVDPVALRKFGRYVEAVEDPSRVLHKVADGSLTAEHADALKTVYPRIYEDARVQVFDTLAEASAKKRKIPRDVRLALGILFEVVSDPTLLPEVIAMVQSAGARGQGNQQPEGERRSKIKPKSAHTASPPIGTDVDRLMAGVGSST